MSLELGFDPGYGAYSTWEEYRAVWELHRARFMTRFDWGIRPQAWWDFEAPKLGVQQPREYEYEKATLWENGLLTPAENRPAGKALARALRSRERARLVWTLHWPREKGRHVCDVASRRRRSTGALQVGRYSARADQEMDRT